MGACSGSGTFVSIDYNSGIREIQQADEEYYGSQDGYSGATNSCDFRYKGDYSDKFKSNSEIRQFIEKRLESLSNGNGEIVCIGIDSYIIYTTRIAETDYAEFIDTGSVYKNRKKGPAVLIKYDPSVKYPITVAEGTISELKKLVHTELRDCKYQYDYYIVGKTKLYYCSYNAKKQRTTQRKTDDKTLVLPVYEYLYYGWFRE